MCYAFFVDLTVLKPRLFRFALTLERVVLKRYVHVQSLTCVSKGANSWVTTLYYTLSYSGFFDLQTFMIEYDHTIEPYDVIYTSLLSSRDFLFKWLSESVVLTGLLSFHLFSRLFFLLLD